MILYNKKYSTTHAHNRSTTTKVTRRIDSLKPTKKGQKYTFKVEK